MNKNIIVDYSMGSSTVLGCSGLGLGLEADDYGLLTRSCLYV